VRISFGLRPKYVHRQQLPAARMMQKMPLTKMLAKVSLALLPAACQLTNKSCDKNCFFGLKTQPIRF
jgi:hypothetical protein